MDLLPSLEPILEQYHAQAYFSGHEHNLQYMHQDDSSVHYVITGGGSLTDYSPIVHYDNGGSKFQYWGSGDIHLRTQTMFSVHSRKALLCADTRRHVLLWQMLINKTTHSAHVCLQTIHDVESRLCELCIFCKAQVVAVKVVSIQW